MRQPAERAYSSIFSTLVFVLIVMGGHLLASGQATESSDRGFSPGKSYSISDIETISMQSGNLMLNMPLGSLPSGRGGMSAAVGLNYNSKLYDKRTSAAAPEDPRFRHTLISSVDGGWRYNYAYRLDLIYKRQSSVDPSCDDGSNEGRYGLKIQLVLPDGGRHTLIAQGHDWNEYLDILPDGQGFCSTTTPITSGPISYFTIDGTFLRLELQLDSDTNWANNAWTLYMPDGSKVERYAPNTNNSQTTNRIYDRNSNFIDIVETAADASYGGHKTTYLKDQLDRKVVIEYDYATGTNPVTSEDRIHSKGLGGATVTTRVTWRNIEVHKTYSGCGSPPATGCGSLSLNKTFKVVDKIYLPAQAGNPSLDNDLYYEFDYNASTANPSNGWGEVSKVTLPSGAYSTYDWYLDGYGGSTDGVLSNRPTVKKLNYSQDYDGTITPKQDVWNYAVTYHSYINDFHPLDTVSVSGPDGGVTKEYYTDTEDNILWKTEQPDGSTVEKVYQDNVPASLSFGGSATPTINQFVKYEYVTVPDNSGAPAKTAVKEYSQDKNGNTTEVKEYDFYNTGTLTVPRTYGYITGLPSGISSYLKRKSVTAYYNDTPDSASSTYTDTNSYHLAGNPRLLRLAKSTEVQNPSGTPQARSELTYDFTSYTTNTKGGNVTESKSWDSTKQQTLQAADSNGYKLVSANYVSTLASYDAFGNPTQTTDSNNVQTTLTYGAVGGIIGLYPTQTVTASGTSIARTSTAAYDFYTGLATSATDVDNNITNGTDYDALGRPVKTKTAVGTALEAWTQTEYNDTERYVVVRSDLEAKGDGKKIAVQHYDQLGRVRLSRTIENPASENPYLESDGIKVQTRYMTSGSYSYQLTSNPYRAADLTNAANEPTMGWTRSAAINTGRHSEVETFSGAGLPAPWGGNNVSTGVVKTDMDADRTLVTDQAGKRRISQSNALGQLVNVWEIQPANGDTEAIAFNTSSGALSLSGLKTSYGYDTLSNLTTVNQGGQTRSFTYSSLSRLKSATNPESGLIQYVYDNNGNLTQKTDARAVVTNYVYDALNRVTNRNYSAPQNLPNYQATSNVTYTYDNPAVPNAKGKLTKVESGSFKTEYQSFDILGRVTQSRQFENNAAYGVPMTYTYNLSGALIEERYPSGRVVKNVLDSNGDLSMVQSKKDQNAGFWNYAQNFTFTAAGAVSSIQLGNGRWESTQFNSRLQPTQIALGAVKLIPTVNDDLATNLLKLNFTYNTTTNVNANADNNGNILSQTIKLPSVVQNNQTINVTATQTYSYDSLNRIKQATETVSNQTGNNWQQTFQYDRFGNRNFDEANTTTILKQCGSAVCAADKKVFNPEVLPGNNRFKLDQDNDGTEDYRYDSSGNTTRAVSKDPNGNVELRRFTFDAENKQTKVETIDANGNPIATIGEYFYDGDGKRVKKVVPSTGETTIFVYDASGKLVAEYSTQVETTNAKTSYLTNDHLGSPRINTDQNGAVIARHDYQPFGEEITRTSYGADDVRKQFTGYERDSESGLDFAQARYYANQHGRFTTVDPVLMMPDRQIDPQQINLYAYCRNNPLSFVDPTGMILDPTTWGKDERKAYEKYLAFLNKDPKKYASELATIEQLKKSDVNYVVRLDQSGTDYSNGKEGGVTTDGKDVFINIANQGNGSEKFSLNATFGHELEHARQFDSGEFGFASDKNGNFVDKNGKYIGSFIGVDITDEVKAWSVTAKLAISTDFMVKGGNKNPEFQFRVLDEFNKSSDKAGVLGKIADNYKSMGKTESNFPSVKGQPVGTLIRPNSPIPFKDGSGNTIKIFGRTH